MSGFHKSYYRYTAFLTAPLATDFSPPPALLREWQSDGIQLKAFLLSGRRVQMICETTPQIAPIKIAQRLKGRLQHHIHKQLPNAAPFDRDFFLGTLGQNDRRIVTHYIQAQVNKSDLVDPLYRKRLNTLRFHEAPSQPPRGKHCGIHDHFLHLVFVTHGRYRMFFPEAKKVATSLLDGATASGIEIYEFSIMPDHAHILLRPDHHRSSAQTLEDLRDASAHILRRTRFWQSGGYTGTVGPYTMKTALQKTRDQQGWIAS
ncbi:transposase [Kiritimatiellota bacterium B12222]|nr:transposase [Kiritimatiellota bacterium B12222]